MSSPSDIPKSRRTSFLDIGGANSLSNFASSYKRAQSYIATSLTNDRSFNDNLSPCTSTPDTESVIQFDGSPSETPALPQRGYDHIDSFAFPEGETERTPLNRSYSRGSRRLSTEAGLLLLGSSTAPQTIFNSINTLMGIAMLSLSFGLKLSGWVVGVTLLILCAWITSRTANILGRILRSHLHIYTYGDIAYLFGGSKFQAFATFTFTLDLLGASISLVLLFSDSFAILFPSVNPSVFKFILVVVTLCMSFLPLSVISSVSLVGILCTVGIMSLIAICGLVSKESPGSLLQPAATSLWPSSWKNVFFSLGIFMCPWGGHPVFPELYRDMRHPAKFSRCCNITFSTTLALDLSIATIGYFMFGQDCHDLLTKNVMKSTGYPLWVKSVFSLLLGILPVSKLALMVRPIISVYENHFNMNKETVVTYKNGKRLHNMTFQKFASRVALLAFLFISSLIFTSFGKVIAFFGSAICFTICVTLPLLFNLKLNADELTTTLRVMSYLGVAVGITGAILGTYGTLVSTAA